MSDSLVTGGGGFIGLAIVRELRRQGRKVRVFGRHRYPAAEAAGAVCVQGDIRAAAAVSRAVEGCSSVFHVAAKAGIWGSCDEYQGINVIGTRNVLAACREHKIQALVHTSTPSVVFDGHDIEGGGETLPYASRPLCHYAATKIIAEQEVLQANDGRLRTAAIRPHLVWGPGDTNLIPRLLARGREGSLRIVGDGQNRVDIAYIDNVAHAHLLAEENLRGSGTAAGKAFFIGQQEPVRLWPWINGLFARMNVSPVTKQISLEKAKAVGWLLEKVYAALKIEREPKMTRFLAEQLAMSHWFSKQQAETLLGYQEQVSTEEGLERLTAWLRQDKVEVG
ncbi:NAD-dependent epimerase/dehydratase family protein [Candidatus Electronema sp. JC]|uniref:NAD-dependent epimerase/dehydratase family protein n=1 Tax=Candidatus Electronema sp. JC TaxID=3401570 RepID=UPI003B439D85